jgi:hypothetical protein
MDVFTANVSLKGEQMKSSSLQTASKTTRKRRSKLSEKQSQVLQTHAFKPGESGNISGRPRKLMTEAYRRALDRKIEGDAQGRTYADAIAEKMISLGLNGDVRAVAEVSIRSDGVPQQSVSFDGDGSSLFNSGRVHDAGREAPARRRTDNESERNRMTTTSEPYEVTSFLAGNPVASAQVLGLTFVRAVDFPSNFSGSVGSVGAEPTASAVYTVKKNGASVGTVTISTSGTFTFSTSGAVLFVSGDRMTIIAPSVRDATLADVAMTLAGTDES